MEDPDTTKYIYDMEARLDSLEREAAKSKEELSFLTLGRRADADYLSWKRAHMDSADPVEELTTLRARLDSARELLKWIAHLHHGCSKGGPEFEPVSDHEWTDCLDKITTWLAEDGEE